MMHIQTAIPVGAGLRFLLSTSRKIALSHHFSLLFVDSETSYSQFATSVVIANSPFLLGISNTFRSTSFNLTALRNEAADLNPKHFCSSIPPISGPCNCINCSSKSFFLLSLCIHCPQFRLIAQIIGFRHGVRQSQKIINYLAPIYAIE